MNAVLEERVDRELPEPAGIERAAPEPAVDTAVADRGMPSLNRPRSIQTRLSRLTSLGLLLALGSGLLGWYYQQTAMRPARSAAAAQASAHTRAEGESTVPPLDVGEPPRVQGDRGTAKPGTAPTDASASTASPWLERFVPRPTLPAQAANNPPGGVPGDTRVYPVASRAGDAAPYAPVASGASGASGSLSNGSAPRDTELSRRLSGPAFAAASTSASTAGAAPAAMMPEPVSDGMIGSLEPSPASSPAPNAERSALGAQLKPTVLAAAQAKLLPSRSLLLPKGALIDCTLLTAIDSSLPGLTTCLTATPTFGADGRVVLLERGTTLVGETRGEARRGGRRLFVLWSEARTPTGVVVELASPATDALGRAGLTGEVDRHFWERFGAATVLSILDGAIQSGVEASRSQGSSAIAVSPAASRDILGEALHDTADITPTIRVAQGTRLQIVVARDLDFRSVYELAFHRAP